MNIFLMLCCGEKRLCPTTELRKILTENTKMLEHQITSKNFRISWHYM